MNAESSTQPKARTELEKAYGKLPLRFEPNEGQTDDRVKFLSRGMGYTLFLTGDGAVLSLQEPQDTEPTAPQDGQREATSTAVAASERSEATIGSGPDGLNVVRMKLVGADPATKAIGLDELPGRINYLVGNDPRKWQTNLPSYGRVRYADVYPGVDLVYYSDRQQQLEYDFVAQPGADPGAIRLSVEGGKSKVVAGNLKFDNREPQLEILANGDLAIRLNGSEVHFRKPIAYQPNNVGNATTGSEREIHGSEAIDVRYVLLADNHVGFKVCGYDKSRTLVIDPTLSYSTYFPSGATGIAVDSSGAAYIVGSTTSATFPVVNPLPAPNNALQGTQDAFVSKLNAAGTALVYATYLGGTNVDQGSGIAVDSSGNAYVTGTTKSSDFPVLNAYQSTLKGSSNVFLTELNAAGNALLYSTYLGGTGADTGMAIARDSSGHTYLAGATRSTDFPVTSGVYQSSLAGSQNAFVAEFDATKQGPSSLVLSGYLGGSSYDSASGVGVDSSGNIVIAGTTASANFPVLSAYQSSIGQATESGFVAKFNSSASALVYSTYLGGNYFNGPPLQNAYNILRGLAVDSAGNAYVAGETDAYDFPLNQAYQGTCQSLCTWDGFIAKFGPSGANIYSTDFGGGTFPSGPSAGSGFYGTSINAIAADSNGNAYVTGSVEAGSFPLMSPIESVFGGGLTAIYTNNSFVSELNATGGLAFSTLLGGSGYEDIGLAIAVDGSNNIYTTGVTYSQDFPIIAGTFDTQIVQGQTNSFVAKISPLNTPAIGVTPGTLTFAAQADGTTSASKSVLVHDFSTSAFLVSNVSLGGAFPSDFQFANNCATPAPAGGVCAIPVTFTPSIIGAETATLTITASGAFGSPATITLSGTGASDGIPTPSPTSANLGSVLLGNTSAPQTFTLTNTGTGPLGSINITVSIGFQLASNNCAPSLAASANCTFTVTATPSVAGTLNGQVTIANDSALGSQTISLTATGVTLPPPLHSNGNILAWGTYQYYPGFYSSSPSVIGTLSGITAIEAGSEHSLALASDGTVWAWGDNYSGELGNGTACCLPPTPGPYGGRGGYRSGTDVPVQVLGLSGVTATAAGQDDSFALKSDGTMWAWGSDNFGELGNGTNTDSTSPVQVSNLSGVTTIAAGSLFTFAIKNDGTVWSWGYNGEGELGNSTTTDTNTPGQITVLTGAIAIAGGARHGLALKNDGTVWAWGDNTYGQLGNTNVPGSSTPIQVGGLSGITDISAGGYFNLALKNDGTVWAWGANGIGQLGNGLTTNSSTPVQVQGISGASDISAGFAHGLALVKSTNVAWAWGRGVDGELGDGMTVNSSTPVRVLVPCGVGLTAIGAGSDYSIALTLPAPSPAPCIASPDTATFYEGLAGSFAVTATGIPTPSLSISPLPNGLSFVDNGNGTGTLSGVPASGTAETYPLTITAQNGVTPNATQAFTLVIGLIGTPGGGGPASSGSNGNGQNGSGSPTDPCACTLTGNYVNPAAPLPLGKTVAPISAISSDLTGTVSVTTSIPSGVTAAQVPPPKGGIAVGPTVVIAGVKGIAGQKYSVYNGSFNVLNFVDAKDYTVTNLGAIGAQPSSGGTSTAPTNPLQSVKGKYTVTAPIVTDATGAQTYSDFKVTSATGTHDFGAMPITTHWDFSPDEDRLYIDYVLPTSGSPCTENLSVYDLSAYPARQIVYLPQTVAASRSQFSPSGEYFVYTANLYTSGCYTPLSNQVDLEIFKVQNVTAQDAVYQTSYIYLPGGVTGEDPLYGSLGTWGFSPDKPESSFVFAYYPASGSPAGDLSWNLVNLTTGKLVQNTSVPAVGSFWQFDPCGDIAGLVQPGQATFYSTSSGNILGQKSFSTSVSTSTVILTATTAGQQVSYGSTIQLGTTATCGQPNTPPGQNVVVQPVDSGSSTAPVTLTFAQVNQAGVTTVTSTSTAPNPPAPTNFQLGSPATYFDVNTTAVYTSSPTAIMICISYAGLKYKNPNAITIQHYQNGTWANVATTIDPVKKTACGSVSSLSPFALAEPIVPAAATITATGGNSQSAAVYAAMSTSLQATVTDANGNPVNGIQVTFTAPSVEPTGGFSGATLAFATTNTAGVAVAPAFSADGIVGSYSVTAAVDGVPMPATFSLANVQASTSVQLAASPGGSLVDGTPVTFTANVISATGGVPTGTVNFLNGTSSLGSVTLQEGIAAFTTSTLPPGNNSIQATYGGDTNFAGSTSSVETVSVNAPDYTLGASSTSATLAAGQSTNPPITVTVTPQGYSGVVTLSCGTLPSYITCAFNPPSGSLTFGNGATSAQNIQLTIAVASTVAGMQSAPALWAMISPFCLLGFLLATSGDRKRLRCFVGCVALTLILGSFVAGCADNHQSSKLPPIGAQTVTVTATGSSASGTISHQLALTVNITN